MRENCLFWGEKKSYCIDFDVNCKFKLISYEFCRVSFVSTIFFF